MFFLNIVSLNCFTKFGGTLSREYLIIVKSGVLLKIVDKMPELMFGCSHQYTTLHLIFNRDMYARSQGHTFLEHNFYIIFTSSPLTLGLQYSVITDCRILDTETFQNFPETFQQGISILV